MDTQETRRRRQRCTDVDRQACRSAHFRCVDEVDAALFNSIIQLGMALGFCVLHPPRHGAEANLSHRDPRGAEGHSAKA